MPKLRDGVQRSQLCATCVQLLAKYKPWDENKIRSSRKLLREYKGKDKVYKLYFADSHECKKCRVMYSIHNGMIEGIRMVTAKELRSMNG